MNVSGKKVLVLGLGETGRATARWLARHGARLRLADSRPDAPYAGALAQEWPAAEVVLGPFTDALFAGVDLLAISPGVPLAEPHVARAVAAGLPVVAVDAAGVRDMVHSGVDGYLTAPSLDEFTARVAELLRDENRRAIMARQAQVTVEEFAAERTALRLAEHYRHLVSGASARFLQQPG